MAAGYPAAPRVSSLDFPEENGARRCYVALAAVWGDLAFSQRKHEGKSRKLRMQMKRPQMHISAEIAKKTLNDF